MKKSKIIIDSVILDKIADSRLMSDGEKLSFLKVIAYLTPREQKALQCLI